MSDFFGFCERGLILLFRWLGINKTKCFFNYFFFIYILNIFFFFSVFVTKRSIHDRIAVASFEYWRSCRISRRMSFFYLWIRRYFFFFFLIKSRWIFFFLFIIYELLLSHSYQNYTKKLYSDKRSKTRTWLRNWLMIFSGLHYK